MRNQKEHRLKQIFSHTNNHQSKRTKWYKRWQFWAIIGFAALVFTALFIPISDSLALSLTHSFDNSYLSPSRHSSQPTEETLEPPSTAREEKLKNRPETAVWVYYDELLKYPNTYDHKFVKISGKVIDIQGDDHCVTYQLKVNDTFDQTAILYDFFPTGDNILLKNEYVDLVAISMGTKTYASALGIEVTMPLLELYSIIK